MNRLIQLSWLPVLVAGLVCGYTMGPAMTVAAQAPRIVNCPDAPPGPCPDQTGNLNMKSGVQQPAEWHTKIPAESLWQGTRTMWMQHPRKATYWSIVDVDKVHPQLADADKSGKSVDPNTLLHDFPYWSRTHSMFVSHMHQKASGNTAQQHFGYHQFIVIMGGSGTVQAGGTLNKPVVLTEKGQPISGELRGASISGGETFQVGKGDWVSIPGNSPTQVKASGADGLTYMVMKINAGVYPWEFIR